MSWLAALPLVARLLVLATILAWVGPAWLAANRRRQIRRHLKAAYYGRDDVDGHIEQAFRHTRQAADLVYLARTSLGLSLPTATERALALLEEADSHQAEVAELHEALEQWQANHLDPIAELIAVQQLLEAGDAGEALRRLNQARERFPDNEELEELESAVR